VAESIEVNDETFGLKWALFTNSIVMMPPRRPACCASSKPTKVGVSTNSRPKERLLLPRPSYQQPPQCVFQLLPRPSHLQRPQPIPLLIHQVGTVTPPVPVAPSFDTTPTEAPVNPPSLSFTKSPVVVTEPSPFALDPKGRLFQTLFVWLFN
jgi:hypothetical protein